ncbi:chromate transporter [Microbacterium sp. H37-C3]|uniref:chromate transporter n=1 Tax=Microbacterium sp. H37-C3 TaxID=3004354 RepID=UPI003FA5F5C4
MTQASTVTARSSVWEVFLVFLRLGATSFGGPVAHLGYFRTEFVERRKWMDDREYADLVALSQFLPGPASSQVGFGVGLLRAGAGGAAAAFVGFTLPSAVLMVGFAYGAAWFAGPVGDGLLTGLKIVAVAIVAQAVWGMARTLTPDKPRAGIAVIALITTMVLVGSVGQIAAILIGATGGLIFCGNAEALVDSGTALI